MYLAASKRSSKISTFVDVQKILIAEFCVIIHNQNFHTMKEYLLLFRNASAENAYLSTSQDMAEDMPKWQAWIGNIAMQGKLVHTAPIEYNGILVGKSEQTSQPYKESNNVLVSGFLICKAEHIEEVQAWGKTCPILKYPHSSVEIRPLVPFPTN